MLTHIVTGSICAVLFATALAAYGFFEPNIIAYALAAWAVICMFLRPKKSCFLTGAFLLCTAIAYGAVTLTGVAQDYAATPEQYLADYNPVFGMYTFMPNTQVTMEQQAGLLSRLDPTQPSVQRTITFITDDIGLRNAEPFTTQQTMLIGGSFLYGSGSTQDALVSTLLQRNHGISAYNVATIGNLDAQALLAFTVSNTSATKPTGIVFMFEGEDFAPFSTESAYPFKRAVLFLGNNDLARFVRNYSTLLPQSKAATAPVVQYRLGSSTLSFSKAYVDATLSTSQEPLPKLAELLNTLGKRSKLVKAVVFIPTKLRVYAPLLGEDAPDIPASPKLKMLRTLAKEAGIPVYDLTPHLQAAAIQAWGTNRDFVWWRDDVVWNEKGAEVGAQLVKSIMDSKL